MDSRYGTEFTYSTWLYVKILTLLIQEIQDVLQKFT